jgi:uncharacterized protein
MNRRERTGSAADSMALGGTVDEWPRRHAARGRARSRWASVVRIVAATGIAALTAQAAEPALPPKPPRHFNDDAGVVPAESVQRLDARLAAFERESSNQFVVAVFPKLPDGAALEDFTVRTAQAWGVGQRQPDNGILLIVFIADRQMRLEVGYGLEAVLPDSLAERILREQIRPSFRAGDYATGLERGIEAVIAATRGEYRGTGRTLAERGTSRHHWIGQLLAALLVIGVIVLMRWLASREHGRSYSRRGRRWHPASTWPTGGGWIGGGGHGGISGGIGGGGGFRGGGGSFGGGGASGSW